MPGPRRAAATCTCVRVCRELSMNAISSVSGGALRGLRRLHDLLLAGNRLRELPRDAFTHTPDLQVLSVPSSPLSVIPAPHTSSVIRLDRPREPRQVVTLPARALYSPLVPI